VRTPDDKLYVYNAIDAACTFECRNAFWNDLNEEGFRPAYDMTIRLYEPLMFMMTRGIKVDRAALQETSNDIAKARDTALEELYKIVGYEINPNSPKQVQNYFYVEKGIPPYKGRDGSVTADDRALQRIARGTSQRKGLREASLIQQIRGYDKLRSSYLEIQFDSDNRLRGAYNPRGTKFGRLSSGKTVFDTGCNLQALDPAFKKFLVADDDYFFIEKDKRQAEWVVVAYLSGDARMLHVVQNGIDPHLYTGTMMTIERLSYELRKEAKEEAVAALVREEHKLIGMRNDEEEIRALRLSNPRLKPWHPFMPRTMSVRQAGKKANHGLNYDEEYRMFALMNEILENEAKQIITAYHRVYVGIRTQFHEWVKQQLSRNDRMLVNCFGRRIRFLDQWGKDLWKSAYSAIPQSTVVDSINQGMCDSYEDESISVKANVDLLAQTHDSVLYQFPKRLLNSPEAWRISQAIDDYISPTMEYNGRSFTIPTDTKVGWNWGGFDPKMNPTGMQEIPECHSDREFRSAVKKALGIR
jgi:DNA polymerase I-like protein with 3'-5' exonuclease and polymerase domains